MYLDYFSLKRHPFRITPDPSLFFAGGARGRGVVLDALVYGITSGEGILKVVGEVGSGKTMLCRMLEERLPKTIEIVYLANPSLSARDIVYAIAIELKLDVDAATDRLLVMHKLQEYLLRKHGDGGSVVVFIEEAQSMPLETLEEVRLLSNLETHRHKLMQIVLFGQPELDRKLEQKSIRQLRERITHSFNLSPLATDEIREYLHFRLRTAGCPWPQLFSPKAEIMLAKASGGLSRRINILADKALLAAYADPATRPDARNSAGERLPVVFPRHVRNAIADSSYRSLEPSRLLRWTGYLAAALGGAFVVGMLAWLLGPDPTASEPAAAPVAAAVDPEPRPTPVAAASSGSIQRSPPPAAEQPSGPVAVASPQVAAEPSPEPAPAPAAAMVTAPQQDAVASSGTGTASVAVPGVAAATAPAPVVAQETAASPPPAALPQEQAASVGTTAQAPAPVQEEIVAEAVVAVPAVATRAPAASISAASTSAASTSAASTPAASAIAASEPARDEPNVAGLDGLIRGRVLASSPWLAGLPQKTGYSVQIFSVTTDNSAQLEEFLEFLVLYDMLDASYLCLISGNSRRKEQWLVLHGEFAGLSEAREFIDDLPPYIGRHSPYARNMEGIACANEAR